MGKKEKNRLPEKQSALVKDFHAKNQKQQQLVNLIEDKEVIHIEYGRRKRNQHDKTAQVHR